MACLFFLMTKFNTDKKITICWQQWISKPLSSDMCNLVSRCLSFGPAASTIRAEATDRTAILYRAEIVRDRDTNRPTETTAAKRPFLPLSPAPLLRLFPYIYAFPHPSTPLYNFRSPLENELFCRAHNPHWSKYSSVPDFSFATICKEENTWRHIPEEGIFNLILSLHLFSDLHSHSVPQCLARKILFTVRGKYVLFSPFMSSSCIQ
jgi:hypothetical protein